MAESLASRVSRVIVGSAHALLDRIEDAAPEAVMEQTLREVDKVAAEVRQELGRVAANRHLAQQQHGHLNQQHASLSGQAEEAIRLSRDDLARAAVARQMDIEAQLPVLEKTLAEWVASETELTGYIHALQAKHREMSAALEALRVSRSPSAAQSMGSPLGNERLQAASQAFDRAYQRQTGLTPLAAAATQQQSEQLRQLEELMRNQQVEQRLAALKAGN